MPVARPAQGGTPTSTFAVSRTSNQTHASTTDPQARLARKSAGGPAKLSYIVYLLMEHRHALIVDMELTEATGFAERDARWPCWHDSRRCVAGVALL